ncbi:MAG: ComF family protein, partial [Planctomycetes bacterium]|nr:ComF family protein [Planctomycetota bacterium]
MVGLGAAVLDLLLPAVCPLCREARGPALCPDCLAGLPQMPTACPLCGCPAQDGPCPACAGDGLAHLDAIHTGFAYRGPMRQLVG